ncbi:MAG: ABC transporter substrate-binding protein [Desulfosporosinus sp.]
MKKYFLLLVLILSLVVTGCGQGSKAGAETPALQKEKVVITDMLGRQVEVPDNLQRIGTIKWMGHLVYALGQQDKMVHQGLMGEVGKGKAKLDPKYAALPAFTSNGSVEEVLALKTQLLFVYYDFDQNIIKQYNDVGVKVVALKGETLDESYQAVRLMGKILGADQQAEAYVTYCKNVVSNIKDRLKDLPADQKPKALMAGPKSIYTAATKDMTANSMIETAGGVNVAKDAVGLWAEISPEQLVKWNPDYIFLGSTKGIYGVNEVLNNPALASVSAIKNKKVFIFPSNLGWWDFPAPQSILGIQWLAGTMHGDKFTDIDIQKFTDDYYKNYMGNSFTELGGKL